MGTAPTVTIVMPHYRNERFLAQAVASILAQEGVDLELWVIDDSSPGRAWVRALARFATDSRLRVFCTSENVGHYRIKNVVIPLTCSPYVACQDADDFSHPSRLRLQLSHLLRARAELVGCGFEYVDEHGGVIARRLVPRNCNLWLRLGKSMVLHSATALFSRRLFELIGGFDGSVRMAADDDFTLRAASMARVRNVAETLYSYRQHAHSLTASPDTGFGSPARVAYTAAARARYWSRVHIRDHNVLMESVQPPPNDVSFELTEVNVNADPTRDG